MKIVHITIAIFFIATTAALLAVASTDGPYTHSIELPSELTTGTDMACQEAVFYVDRYFEAHPDARAIRFVRSGWVPFKNPLVRSEFYAVFMDCIIHDGGCGPFE
jgi:hypothetical protein